MSQPANKRQVFEEMLADGKTMLHLDARREGVDVPERFRKDQHLRLDFSYRFRLTTFEIDDTGVTASLKFGPDNYLCVIPWTAVFGMMSHVTSRMEIWPEDMPPELLDQAAAMVQESQPDEDEPAVVGGAVRRHGHLRVIK